MAELDIKERQIGDVTILDMDGQIRINKGSIALRSAIRRLVEEDKKNVVLNLAGVTYVDSSGVGELIACFTTLCRDHGMLRLASLTDDVQNRLVITKLLTVFDAYESVEEAVNSFATENKYFSCPVRGCGNLILVSDPEFKHTLTCTTCGAEFRLRPLPSGESNQVSIGSLRLPTYETEHIRIDPGAPTTIHIVGNLDLFASEVLEKAWLTVPPPRRVIFHLPMSGELTPRGIHKLLALCAVEDKNNAAVILAWPYNKTAAFPTSSSVYTNERSAVEALGDIPGYAPWVVELESQR